MEEQHLTPSLKNSIGISSRDMSPQAPARREIPSISSVRFPLRSGAPTQKQGMVVGIFTHRKGCTLGRALLEFGFLVIPYLANWSLSWWRARSLSASQQAGVGVAGMMSMERAGASEGCHLRAGAFCGKHLKHAWWTICDMHPSNLVVVGMPARARIHLVACRNVKYWTRHIATT